MASVYDTGFPFGNEETLTQFCDFITARQSTERKHRGAPVPDFLSSVISQDHISRVKEWVVSNGVPHQKVGVIIFPSVLSKLIIFLAKLQVGPQATTAVYDALKGDYILYPSKQGFTKDKVKGVCTEVST